MRAISLPIVAAVCFATALSGCSGAPHPTGTPLPSSTETPGFVPGLPTDVSATKCLPDDLVAKSTGVAVAASSDTEPPPPGPIDDALAQTPRVLCTYDLVGGDRVGYTPLVTFVGDVNTMDAAVGSVVGYDDCTQASGYLSPAQNVYYVWTGTQFAAAYLLVGDQTDPEAWLAKIIDDAGLCVTAAG